MAERPRFLLGYGKELHEVPYSRGTGDAAPPYSIQRQRERLLPQIARLDTEASQLPSATRPDGQVVAVVQLHPAALSRSAFPDQLLRRAGMRFLGSKPSRHRPEAGRGHDVPEGLPVTDLFVAVSQESLHAARTLLLEPQRENHKDAIGEDFLAIESIRLMTPEDRVKRGVEAGANDLELVLHYNATMDRRWRNTFAAYAKSVGVEIDKGIEFQRKDLLFMTASAPRRAADELALFAFVRAIRPLPVPRPLEEPVVLRTAGARIVLPLGASVDPKIRMAIFDGGLPLDHPFVPWARAIEPQPHHHIGHALAPLQAHGLAVTSSALFGPLKLGTTPPPPYCSVDHYRVLGANTLDKKGLYRSLAVIDEVLDQSTYDVISLSIGPYECMDDDQVSAWTTLLDDHLGTSDSLGLVAVGNNGIYDEPHHRIMPPADSVNALGVGACTSTHGDWERAPYSARGPGRCPGIIKPDLVFFGGTDQDKFLFAGPRGTVLEDLGTSFATPAMARLAAGLRAHFGSSLSPLAIKALLVNSAEDGGHSPLDVGFGRVPPELESLIICPPGTVRILYYGKLRPGGMLRAPLTIPTAMRARLSMRVTACYSCQTDAQSPGEYSRAALEFYFRPNANKFNIDKETGKRAKQPATAPFFSQHDHLQEHERRLASQKWNTVMHGSHDKLTSAMQDPCFDIHYVARAPGVSTTPSNAPELSYALVVTLQHHATLNLYEQVVAEFPQLLVIEPTLGLQIAVT
jgi:hypothetical protein